MTTPLLPFWLAASFLPDIGSSTILRWLNYFSDIKALMQASEKQWREMGIPEKHIVSLQDPAWGEVEIALVWAEKEFNNIIVLTDNQYPALLKEISDPPIILYVQGDLSALSKKQIAMVGARNATPMGLKNAENFAKCLVQAGFAITSGLALGIDGAAHRGALLGEGVTIAVSGTGLNHIYPRSHRSLAAEICNKNGAIISEFPLDVGPHAFHFPRRNRIIAGLSLGTIVVEAAIKSGSLITARHAIEHGREVFAIPGSIHNPLARGCHHLIRQGAKLIETANDIVEELGALQLWLQEEPEPKALLADLTEPERRTLNQIDYDITPIDMIICGSGLTASDVSSILLGLELRSLIASVPGGYVRTLSHL